MVSSKKTLILEGAPVSGGVTYGEARVVYNLDQTIEERSINKSEIEAEIIRLNQAVEDSVIELLRLKESAGKKIGGPVARIFESQIMIASDPEFLKSVRSEIESSLKCAEYIYNDMVEKSLIPLKESHEPYLQQMALDIQSVSFRVIRRLTGQTTRHLGHSVEDCIFVSQIFTPAEVLTLYEGKVRAIVTSGGSTNSHMTVIARSLLIPTIVGVKDIHLKVHTGDRLIVDGDKGTVTIHPSLRQWNELRKKKVKVSTLQILKINKIDRIPPQTRDDYKIEVAANIDIPSPIDQVLSDYNIGIGLFRTEFLYLQNGHFPSEDKQFEIYRILAERYRPQPVVIRTFDLGSDKYYDLDDAPREKNPALGWRGIRTSLDMPEIFKDQIKAILRASAFGEVKILLPMVADVSEILRARRIITRAKAELTKAGCKFNDKIEIGAMIEIPSAAITAEAMAPKVDFFSIGSNDLTQYTLAADRDNSRLARTYNSTHPAVLKMIQMTAQTAHKHNIPITICGEMAADILAIPLLIGLGIQCLSMNPTRLYAACNLIARLHYADVLELTEKVLKQKTYKEVEHLLFDFNAYL